VGKVGDGKEGCRGWGRLGIAGKVGDGGESWGGRGRLEPEQKQ